MAPHPLSNGTTKPEMTHLQPKTTLSQFQTIGFLDAFSMPSDGTETSEKPPPYDAMKIEERLAETSSEPLSSPQSTFGITALVAPTTTHNHRD
jgi:hypothetical protein